MKKFSLLLALLGFLGLQVVFAQTREISGLVTSSEDGSSIPGASVVVKGTTLGTITDMDGKFTLKVPENAAALTVTFVGMKSQEIPLTSQSTYTIKLEPENVAVDEVVVTALGISREKKSLGYAVQKVSGDDLSTVKTDNFANLLSGRAAGVQIKANGNMGGSTNVVIRGNASLTGNNQALFVVDGIPINNSTTNNSGQTTGRSGYDYGNAASDINPDDIESISVLKGAAATALYGSRAANGVIMITTKSGKKNKRGVGVSISSNVTVGTIDKSTFPKYQHNYGGGYGPYYSDGNYPGLYQYDVNGDGTPDLVVPTTEDASMGEKFDPNLMVYQYDAFVPESPNYGKATPWVAAKNGPDTFFNTALTKSNSVDISGAGDKSTFRLGYTNFDQTGIMPNSELKKNNFNFNATYNILDNLKVTAMANYINTQGKGRNSTGYSDNILSSFRQWFEVNVDIKEQERLFKETGRNVTWNRHSPTSGTPEYWDNPYWVRFKNYETDKRNRLIGYTKLDWTATDWMTLTGRVSVDTYNELQEERKAMGSVAGEFGVGRPDVTSGYSRLNRAFIETNIDLMANFNKDLTDKLNLTGLLGMNIRKTKIDQVYASTNGGLSVPDVYALSNSASPMLPPDELYSIVQVNGVFAQASLGYNNLLFLDAAIRRDQSSTLPLDNNAYYYPSVSGSFIFSNLVQNDWLSLGKVRLNYAEVGNSAPFASINDTYVQNSPFNGNPMVTVPNTKNNENLKPEKTKSLEAGLEMNFWNNRLGFDVAYYDNRSVDQIMPVAISYATGYSRKYVNAGEVQNKGIELQLNASPVVTNKFRWDINVNWSKNDNKVVSLAAGVDNLQIAALQGGVTINARVGEPYGTIQGTDFVYKNGQPVVGSNGYYEKTSTSDVVIGNVNPDWTGGVSNTLTYGDFALSFLVDMQQGGSVFSLDQWYGMGTGLYAETDFINDLGNPVRNTIANGGGLILPGVKEDGTPNDVRVPGNDYRVFGWSKNPNSKFVYDASYVKLRSASLTYNFPKTMLNNTFITGASLSVVGSNLWIIHKNLPHADPEASQGAGNIQGWQSGVMPTTRNIGFSVKVQF
ncbi:SusC/RagA family TonB-linked outer membrane protein [Prolixibacter denitrificans]|uniref:SusC/RagA family TonB-linked outer membrane protein n=1 Tax=Prolixibacter denitrificans TaxID=1541063 RepID=A0A2P8CKD0_9BACT|nr:SusC/RagA family TonB-linked outer membrane protein [Prolixibacter denitrificans]PSK85427.1 TonB-linked SusC/RagA family outer membrane protein [Prolixibacter denitrificans]GET20048.1 SusC/RagA family TonB-linked outer membrane protein [Prolixibacter denitrificans]